MPHTVTNPALTGDTLLELRTEILERGFQYLSTGRINKAINTALDQICSEENWDFLIGSADGNMPFVVPGLLNVRSVVTSGNLALPLRDFEELVSSGIQFGQVGVPSFAFVQGENVFNYPSDTTGTYSASLHINPRPASADGTAVIVPKKWSHVVIDRAVRELEKDRHNWEAVRLLREEYIEQLEQMRDRELTKQSVSHGMTVITSDAWA